MNLNRMQRIVEIKNEFGNWECPNCCCELDLDWDDTDIDGGDFYELAGKGVSYTCPRCKSELKWYIGIALEKEGAER